MTTEREAQAALAEIALQLVAIEDRLTRIAESLPVPHNQEDMLEHRVPYDLATQLLGLIECVDRGPGKRGARDGGGSRPKLRAAVEVVEALTDQVLGPKASQQHQLAHAADPVRHLQPAIEHLEAVARVTAEGLIREFGQRWRGGGTVNGQLMQAKYSGPELR